MIVQFPYALDNCIQTVRISVYNILSLKVYFKTHSPLGNPLICGQYHLFKIFLETALMSNHQEKNDMYLDS